MHRIFQTQVGNGDATRMVLYHYDFVGGSRCLNLRGRDQLARIAAMLPENFYPIIIERTPDAPELAEARRLVVLNELALGPFPVPPERVIIGLPLTYGLNGAEAIAIYQNLLSQTQRMGAYGGGGSGPIGGSTFGSGTGTDSFAPSSTRSLAPSSP
jgi:hypothetical protein